MREILVIFALLFFSSVGWSLTPIHIQTFEDSAKTQTLESLLSEHSTVKWAPGSSDLQFGYTKSRHWVRFEIPENALMASENFYLSIPYTYLAKVSFYVTEHGQILSQETQGMGVPLAPGEEKPLTTGTFAFFIPKYRTSGPVVYYVSVEGDFPLAVPMEILNEISLQRQQPPRNLLLGLFFGILFVAFGFNAYLASVVRSRMHLFYCLFVVSALMLFLGHERISVQFLWPHSPHWALMEMHLYGGAAFLFYVLFVRNFLETAKNTPWLDRALLFLTLLSTVRAIWMIFDLNQTVAIIGQSAIMLGNFLILGIAGVCLYRRVRSAKFFLLSSFIFNAGYILFILQKTNIWYFGKFVEYTPHIGVLAEALLLSFALVDRIRETNKQLQLQKIEIINSEKMAALGRMAAGISHEINNPLTIIYTNANSIESLSTQLHPPLEKIRHSSQAIERNVMRISKIIKSMRAIARDATLDPVVDHKLSEILNDVSTLCHERFRNGEVSLKVAPAGPDVFVSCRSPEISQVLINLMNNAFDAVQGQPQKEVRIDWTFDADRVLISVSDTGPGIPEKIREHIYEPFFTSKPVGKGTGLGLSICKSLIENHGGQLWLEASSPQTKFTFSLPATHFTEPPAEPDAHLSSF
jgi:signal transduction histidine kinase